MVHKVFLAFIWTLVQCAGCFSVLLEVSLVYIYFSALEMRYATPWIALLFVVLLFLFILHFWFR